ncbi:hypothetical protein F5Y03DRAFT_363990 [Xylaria venustula]|nr:hypothetical protein F5Y03DRAFT_363990 [Xylaria venustula]
MEVLGTVAATAQLVGMAMSILDSIAQLHDLIKHVPDRYRRWNIELGLLRETIDCIQHNPALQTMHVGRVMKAMCPKIESLLRLCKKYTPPSTANPIIKVLKNLSAHSVESLITEHLQSLEHDKTTLLLAIQLPAIPNTITDSCLAKDIMPGHALQSNYKFDTKDLPWNPIQELTDSDRSLALVEPIDKSTQNHSKQAKQKTIPQNLHLVASRETIFAEQSSPNGHSTPRLNKMNMTEQSGNFKGIKMKGCHGLIGHSMAGTTGDFEDIDLDGRDLVIGIHDPNMLDRRFTALEPQISWHQPHQSADSHASHGHGGVADIDPVRPRMHGGGQQDATKDDSERMVLDEEGTDEKAGDRMDWIPNKQ